MAGIRVIDRHGKSVLHPILWVDPEEVPVVFLVMKDDATALAHPDYIAETLDSVARGDLDLADAWDDLLIKTPEQPYPQKCRVRVDVGTDRATEILVANQVVYRFT